MSKGEDKEFDDILYTQLQQLCAEGDELASHGRYSAALNKYWEAWGLLPEPKIEWEAATWILAAVGDASYLGGDYEAGRDNLSMAMRCPNALGNPFLHLRLGQCQYELGNLDRAVDELARAYMGGGKEIFEDDAGKYFELVKASLTPPVGGEW